MTIAIDTETFLIFPGNLAPTLVCVSWATTKGEHGVIHHGDPELLQGLIESFEDHHVVFHNAPFDLAVLIRKFPQLLPVVFRALDAGRIHDTCTREKLLDLARGTFRFEEDEDGKLKAKGYSLFDLTRRRLGRMLDKDTWRLRYHDLHPISLDKWPKGACDYAVGDAVATLEIFEAQESLKQYLKNEPQQVQAHFALHLMSCWGIRTNLERVDILEKDTLAAIEKTRPPLIAAGLVRTDGTRNTKAAVKRMVAAMGDDCIITDAGLKKIKAMDMTRAEVIQHARDKGKLVSVSADATMYSGDTTLMDYAQYTRLRNLLTGSIKDLKTGTVTPVQSRFEPIMETGRTSSSGPNIQNLRRAPGVRECYVPRDGCVIAACDYKAAELHTLAQVCFDLFGQSALGDALNRGVDVHLWMGAQLANISYTDAETLLKAGDAEIKDMRQLAKAANFGLPGGLGARRFVGFAHSYGVSIDVQTAAKIKALWFTSWPEMRQFFKHVESCSMENGFYYVQQPRAPRLRSGCTYTSACNSHFQGLAADGAKAALYAVTKAQHVDPDSDLYGTKCLAFVHDEILIEAPEPRAHDVAMELSRIMADEFNKFVPDCPTEAEPTIMRYWSKKAEQVWTDDGRLMPWAG